MEWKIRVNEKIFTVETPSYLMAHTTLPAKIEGKAVRLRWDPRQNCFFISVNEDSQTTLERCLKVRNFEMTTDPHTGHRILNFQKIDKELRLIEASIQTLSQSRAVQSSQTRKRITKQFSPLTGKIIKLSIKVGDTILKGEQVAVIEAMKMENKILSEMTGIVKEIKIQEQGKVNFGDELFCTDPIDKP